MPPTVLPQTPSRDTAMQQQQLQLQQPPTPLTQLALRQNEEIIRTNESAMHHIADEMEGLQGLFSELGRIVNEQHETVETISTQASRSADDTSAAVEELRRLERKQSEAGCLLQ